MARMGLLEPAWRLPLVPPSAQSKSKIEKVLSELNLLRSANAAD